MSESEPHVDEALAIAHGLAPEEYARFVALIGRVPTFTELGIVSAMWNEHCSYKSSRLHLRKLPTKAPWVIQGPGENAGVIDIGDGDACVFKMESHNHPSFIEPYQGAATGVGGILRDVFTMGARPIACLDLLRFGAPDHPRTRRLVGGVVAGIGGYGNSFGVPTVGGSVGFHKRYDGNILVNAMAVGVARADAIFYAKATGVGNPIVYLGSKTGRDGIHGATMASAAFEAGAEEKRPTVQVGDPFAEKLLLEACLELMASGAVIAIQDMGAAGLTSSAVEMGAKGDLGVELDLDRVPCREAGMSAYEMMLSESQERMLMVLHPEKAGVAEAIFRKWGLDFAIIGNTTAAKRFVVRHRGEVKADLPIKELGDEAPVYDRPWTPTPASPVLSAGELDPPLSAGKALLKLLASPDLGSKRWVYEQYDSLILGNTVEGPGGDAAVVRLGDGPKGLALTTDVTERYCEADPVQGGRQAVAEAWRNLVAVGARPLALTDNLNFGNPEKPAAMGQLVGCLRGDRRGFAGAGFSDRFRQRLALQRDHGSGNSADAVDRRRRAAGGCRQGGLARVSPGERSDPLDRGEPGLARSLRLARDLSRSRRGRAAARRSRRGKAERRVCAGPDRRGAGLGGARRLGRRSRRRLGGNGYRQRDRRDDRRGGGRGRAARLLFRRGSRALRRDISHFGLRKSDCGRSPRRRADGSHRYDRRPRIDLAGRSADRGGGASKGVRVVVSRVHGRSRS